MARASRAAGAHPTPDPSPPSPTVDEQRPLPPGTRVAVLIPCYDEEQTIGRVVEAFRTSLPEATVYVYDNNSTDRTREVARSAGAAVGNESLQGKGNVVRRMFGDVEADAYVLVDGDDTYDAASAPILVRRLLDEGLDMVAAARAEDSMQAYRLGHRFGNVMLTRLVAWIFGDRFRDMLSGYKVFSRRFVKSFPALATGFEIETELTIHALELRMPVAEVETPYRSRPSGSASKLNTIRDGFRILKTIGLLVKEERPLQFFFLLFLLLGAVSVGLAWPILLEFLETGLVPRFPTAILATGIMLLAFLSLVSGLILDTVTLGRREMKRMWYLSIPGPGAASAPRQQRRKTAPHSYP
jgi:glycosyltransferase involved in cell wall biosynthesis